MARHIKKCSICKVEKSIDDFSNDKQRKDGKRPSCKDCMRLKSKEYRSRESVKEKESLKKKKYYENNKDKILSRNKKWREENKESFRGYSKKFLSKESNRIKLNNWRKDKMKNDRIFFLKNKISNLKSHHMKNISPYVYLMCDIDFFADWLGLGHSNLNSKDNLDHIVPISFCKSQCEFSAINHYSNFQIITDFENKSKGNRYIKFDSLNRVLNNNPNPDLISKILERENFKIIF